MTSSLQQRAVQRVLAHAASLGVDPPRGLPSIDHGGSMGAVLWVEANPAAAQTHIGGCCYGEALGGPERCTCWTPVYATSQATPVLPATAADIRARGKLCGDCAFRKDSPERADEWAQEELLALPESGDPFWCHDGMRRPVRWEHPDGRTVPGSSADWHPARVGAVPFRADGTPALLCAGWAARTRTASRRDTRR